MVAKTNDPKRIDLALTSIRHMLDDLPEIAAEWDVISTDERLAWSLDWGNEMVKLQHIADALASARLDPDRTAQYRQLADRVAALVSTVDRLGLRRPADVVLGSGPARV